MSRGQAHLTVVLLVAIFFELGLIAFCLASVVDHLRAWRKKRGEL